MRFSGRLHTHGNRDGPGLAVEIEVGAEHLTVSSDGNFVGRYALSEVESERDEGDHFELSIDGEQLIFTPVDAAAFRSLGIRAIGQGRDRRGSRRRLMRSFEVATPDRSVGELPAQPKPVRGADDGGRAGDGQTSVEDGRASDGDVQETPAIAAAADRTVSEPPTGWEESVEQIRRELNSARGATRSAFDGFIDLSTANEPVPDGPRLCVGELEPGRSCSVVVVSATGFCSAHDPDGLVGSGTEVAVASSNAPSAVVGDEPAAEIAPEVEPPKGEPVDAVTSDTEVSELEADGAAPPEVEQHQPGPDDAERTEVEAGMDEVEPAAVDSPQPEVSERTSERPVSVTPASAEGEDAAGEHPVYVPHGTDERGASSEVEPEVDDDREPGPGPVGADAVGAAPDIDWMSLARRLVGAVEDLDEGRLMPEEAMALASLAEAACRVAGMVQDRSKDNRCTGP